MKKLTFIVLIFTLLIPMSAMAGTWQLQAYYDGTNGYNQMRNDYSPIYNAVCFDCGDTHYYLHNGLAILGTSCDDDPYNYWDIGDYCMTYEDLGGYQYRYYAWECK